MVTINDARFIKTDNNFNPDSGEYAPLFRRKIYIPEEVKTAKIYVCGLGYGYYYINGRSVTDDLFTAPVSIYEKTLWYNTYDVSHLLTMGDNLIAAECGNGWYNEAIKTYWHQNEMAGRDMPKLWLALEVNGEIVVVSDEKFKCSKTSAVIFNQLRAGEVFDARLYDENWNTLEYNDDEWEYAVIDENPPKGVMRECMCEPIREFEEFQPIRILEKGDKRYIFDFGKNMSGYVRVKIKQKSGDVISLKYFEELDENNEINDTGFDSHYYDCEFQTDRFICGDSEFVRSPKFTYHGFRYVYAMGLDNPTKETLTAVFVHQAVDVRTTFECSDENINKLFKAGVQSTLSNLFYMPTDCPTREKYGWYNDLQCSAEQMLTNFKTENVLEKWWYDICDTMLENGMLPGAMPIYDTAYDWGNGPVSEGALFEIPYRIYLHTGNSELLKKGIPFFKRNIGLLKSKINKDGEINYGLWDWAAPDPEDCVGNVFINDILYVKFLRILKLSFELNGDKIDETEADIKYFTNHIIKKYIDNSGECIINRQTSVAMLIYFGLYNELEPLANQLKRLIEENNFYHDCGIVGLRCLYVALNKCGLYEYAYKILTAKGCPSYMDWIEHGATTLYECWNIDLNASRNHHMYSDFMSWLIKTAGGINRYDDIPTYKEVEINPYFFEKLSYVRVSSDTNSGEVSVFWERRNGKIKLEIKVPDNMIVHYKENIVTEGIHTFDI